MQLFIAGHREVAQLLPMAECLEVMADALRTLARGEAVQPLRSVVLLPDQRGALALMPSYLGPPQVTGAKVITVFGGNVGTRYESHQGGVLLFEGRHGSLLAMLDAASITAIRTAAVSGVATRALARADAADLAILGSGTQARTHLEAMRAVRPISRVRVWSRTPEHARRFAEEASREIAVEVVKEPREAVAGADIICTTTATSDPIVLGEWIKAGAHINAVGASRPGSRELDTAAVARSRIFVDRRESAENEADDIRVPLREGAIDEDAIQGELGEVLAGQVPGRTGPEEITLFKSLGLAVEDLAAALHVYTNGLARGIGTVVEFGGERE
jgi:ornithine cyclodeaminase